jgi:hypothetical protein
MQQTPSSTLYLSVGTIGSSSAPSPKTNPSFTLPLLSVIPPNRSGSSTVYDSGLSQKYELIEKYKFYITNTSGLITFLESDYTSANSSTRRIS